MATEKLSDLQEEILEALVELGPMDENAAQSFSNIYRGTNHNFHRRIDPGTFHTTFNTPQIQDLLNTAADGDYYFRSVDTFQKAWEVVKPRKTKLALVSKAKALGGQATIAFLASVFTVLVASYVDKVLANRKLPLVKEAPAEEIKVLGLDQLITALEHMNPAHAEDNRKCIGDPTSSTPDGATEKTRKRPGKE